MTKIKDERTPIGFDSAADRLRNNVMRSIHCWLVAGRLLFPLYTFTAAAQVIKEKASESKPYCGARRSWLSTTRP